MPLHSRYQKTNINLLPMLPEAEQQALNTTWEALTDFATGENALAVVDTSGSMYWGSDSIKQLTADTHPSFNYRCFCDSAPVLERYWALQAGIGWIGRNHQLIIPKAGSMFVLGELFLDFELEYNHPMKNKCGDCQRCLDVCPTKVLSTHPFDAARCLSYQLIENRQELSEETREKMGNFIYGCDRCQQACPWNSFAQPTDISEMQPSEEFLDMTKDKWENLTLEDYRRIFKGSAVKRVKYEGLMRNIDAAKKNGK